MIYIISGTNRKDSKTFEVSKIVQKEFKAIGKETKIIDLCDLPFDALHAANYKNAPSLIAETVQSLNKSDGIFIVTPEYNGSFPGILKYFIDYFSYPETFEHRPVAFIGLGWRWGGLRPVEHLQQVFNYRNSYIFPQRVFISNAPNVVTGGELTDENCFKLLQKQVKGFVQFIEALKSQGMDANSINSKK
jgi:chromate reductase